MVIGSWVSVLLQASDKQAKVALGLQCPVVSKALVYTLGFIIHTQDALNGTFHYPQRG